MNQATKRFSAGRLSRVSFAAALCVLYFSSPAVNAQTIFKPFSADQIQIVGNKTSTGKIYGTDKAFRVEVKQSGNKSVVIMRFDRNVMWMLIPDQKMYMEMRIPDTAELAALQAGAGAKTQRESLGSEQVGAYHCDKARVRVTYQGREYTNLEWAAKELSGFVVKRADEKGSWSTEYRNIQRGPQDPSLFEVPAGYQKMDMGGMGMPQ
jgi:Domain of unknown function (DUF4412)